MPRYLTSTIHRHLYLPFTQRIEITHITTYALSQAPSPLHSPPTTQTQTHIPHPPNPHMIDTTPVPHTTNFPDINTHIPHVNRHSPSVLRIATGCTHDTSLQHLCDNILPIKEHLQLHTSQTRQKAQHSSYPLHTCTTNPTDPRTVTTTDI